MLLRAPLSSCQLLQELGACCGSCQLLQEPPEACRSLQKLIVASMRWQELLGAGRNSWELEGAPGSWQEPGEAFWSSKKNKEPAGAIEGAGRSHKVHPVSAGAGRTLQEPSRANRSLQKPAGAWQSQQEPAGAQIRIKSLFELMQYCKTHRIPQKPAGACRSLQKLAEA